ncbi:hypothetical protein ILYODFUR_033491 [Ilyodon furcidens]|uniref:Secreted protein n=1 Tax=Ilyodon furcidens TaxID=33524 RepID=A0ABV0UBT5_9TELE
MKLFVLVSSFFIAECYLYEWKHSRIKPVAQSPCTYLPLKTSAYCWQGNTLNKHQKSSLAEPGLDNKDLVQFLYLQQSGHYVLNRILALVSQPHFLPPGCTFFGPSRLSEKEKD